jgi:uncharacterized protein YkwD
MLLHAHALSDGNGGAARSTARSRRGVLRALPALLAAGLALGVLPATTAVAAEAPAAAPSAVSPSAVAPAIAAVRDSQAVALVCFDRDLLAYINKARAAYHLAPLIEKPGLVSSANLWATHLAAGSSFQHNPKLSATVLASMPSVHTFGENIATFTTGSMSAYAMLKAYLASPRHRANLLNPNYRYVGIVTRSGAKNSFNAINFAG